MMRLATFDLADCEDHETAWNDWADELHRQGLRPADEPLRWTETTMTFRVFSLAIGDGLATTTLAAVGGAA